MALIHRDNSLKAIAISSGSYLPFPFFLRTHIYHSKIVYSMYVIGLQFLTLICHLHQFFIFLQSYFCVITYFLKIDLPKVFKIIKHD
jgi:hypothetical protein